MRKFSVLVLSIIIACSTLVLAGCGSATGAQALPAGSATLYYCLSDVLVYGESALLFLTDSNGNESHSWERSLSLRYTPAASSGSQDLQILCGEAINQGLPLWQLEAGSYSFAKADLPIVATDLVPLEGYTLPRDGIRKHWQFTAEKSRLQLLIEDVTDLPSGLADIYIDVGHGGSDTGAAAGGYVEAKENLRSSLYMRDQLQKRGFVVMMSREDMSIPGGEAAEDNPYIGGARVDSSYSSNACYLLSNHLNGGGGSNSGFQLYTSVLADTTWADLVAEQFRQSGWYHNNSNIGLVKDGIYKRWARDNAHTGRDYYFILRETGGLAVSPKRYSVYHDEMADNLRHGPEGILFEYLFLDNRHDMNYWDENYQSLVDAALAGCYNYWQIEQ